MTVTDVTLNNRINREGYPKMIEISSEKTDFVYYLYQDKDYKKPISNIWCLECNSLSIRKCLDTENFKDALKKANFCIQSELSHELANQILRFETLGNEFFALESGLEEEKELFDDIETEELL